MRRQRRLDVVEHKLDELLELHSQQNRILRRLTIFAARGVDPRLMRTSVADVMFPEGDDDPNHDASRDYDHDTQFGPDDPMAYGGEPE